MGGRLGYGQGGCGCGGSVGGGREQIQREALLTSCGISNTLGTSPSWTVIALVAFFT